MLSAVRAKNPDAYNPVSTRPDSQRGHSAACYAGKDTIGIVALSLPVPAAFEADTTHCRLHPLSSGTTVYAAEVAPPIIAPLRYH